MKVIDALPDRFKTWNEFWRYIIQIPGWDHSSHKIVQLNEIGYEVSVIKAHCFDEIMAILPDKESIIKQYSSITYQTLDSSEEDWMYRLTKLL